MRPRISWTLAAVSLLALGAASCGAPSPSGGSAGSRVTTIEELDVTCGVPAGAVVVSLANCAVNPVGVVAAGPVTFHAIPPSAAENRGAIRELVIASAGTPGETPEAVAVIANVLADRPRDLALELEPGEYELQCRAAEPGPVESRTYETVATARITVAGTPAR